MLKFFSRSHLRDKHEVHSILFYVASALFLITLPFSIKLNVIAAALLVLNWVFSLASKTISIKLKDSGLAFLMLGLFLIHVIGLLYTSNLKVGFFELEKKISFVLLPTVLLTQGSLNGRRNGYLLVIFSIISAAASVYCLGHAYVNYLITRDTSHFFYHELSSAISIHAVYFSWYLSFSVVIMLVLLSSIWNSSTIAIKSVLSFGILILLLTIILLSSKLIIVVTIILVIILLYRFLLVGKSIAVKSLALLGFILFFSFSIGSIPNVRERFEEIVKDEFHQENPLVLKDFKDYHFTGGNIRLAIWRIISLTLTEDKAWLFGVGTGDSQDVLTKQYIQRNVYPGDEVLGFVGYLNYNAHSQFFQYLITFGLFGLFYFIFILFFLFRYALKLKSLLFICFLIIFSAFCLTESTLEVQKGIVFFTFMSSLLMNKYQLPKLLLTKSENKLL